MVLYYKAWAPLNSPATMNNVYAFFFSYRGSYCTSNEANHMLAILTDSKSNIFIC